MEANQLYTCIRTPDGRETTVSTRNLSPYPGKGREETFWDDTELIELEEGEDEPETVEGIQPIIVPEVENVRERIPRVELRS